jgi:hypothetical protein
LADDGKREISVPLIEAGNPKGREALVLGRGKLLE